MVRTAEPTSSVAGHATPRFSAAMRSASKWANLSAVALLMRSSTVTSLSSAERDAKWTTQ